MTDKEIDELVYKIYDITDSEKKIIEESLKWNEANKTNNLWRR